MHDARTHWIGLDWIGLAVLVCRRFDQTPRAVCMTRSWASLGLRPTLVVVSPRLAAYNRLYALRRRRPPTS